MKINITKDIPRYITNLEYTKNGIKFTLNKKDWLFWFDCIKSLPSVIVGLFKCY